MVFTEYLSQARCQAAWGVESAWGTAGTANKIFGDVINVNIGTWDNGFKPYKSADGSNSRLVSKWLQEVRKFAIQVSFYLISNENIAPGTYNQHFAYGIGTLGTEGGSAGQYTHPVSVGNTLTSITIDWGWLHASAPLGLEAVGCVPKKYRLEYKRGEPLKCIIDYVCKSVAQITSFQAITAATTAPAAAYEVAFTYGSLIPEVLSAALELDNDLYVPEYADSTNTNLIGEPHPGKFMCKLDVDMVLPTQAKSLFATFYGSAHTQDATIVFSRSAKNMLSIALTNLVPQSLSAPMDLSGNEVKQAVKFDMDEAALTFYDNDANW